MTRWRVRMGWMIGRQHRRDWASLLAGAPVVLFVLVCCAPVAGWVVWQIASRPGVLAGVMGETWGIVVATLVYNGAAAVMAGVLAMPVAIVIGRARAGVVGVMLLVCAAGLLMPSIVYSYGWLQVLYLMGVEFRPQGAGDVLRCILTLAGWLWPVFAVVVGMSLRRMDESLRWQAMLDGAVGRITLRHMAPAMLGAGAVVLILAMQEFSIYERSGIRVVATEVRAVFGATWDGERGAAEALATGLPVMVAVMGLAGWVAWLGRGMAMGEDLGGSGENMKFRGRSRGKIGSATENTEDTEGEYLRHGWSEQNKEGNNRHRWTQMNTDKNERSVFICVYLWRFVFCRFAEKSLYGGWAWAAFGVMGFTLVTPIVALVLSLQRRDSIGEMWAVYGEVLAGSIFYAGVVGMSAVVVGMSATVFRFRCVAGVALSGFLIGGQLVAIALIRIYNRPGLGWVYDGWAIAVVAELALFGWIAVMAGGMTWGRSWREIRWMAECDGATAWQVARWVVLPLAWPMIGAAGALCGVLALSEVPAMVLLQPQRPPTLIPWLVTWVHKQRDDAMIQGSLLLVAMVMGLAAVAWLLGWAGMRRRGRLLSFFVFCIAMGLNGCGRASQPEAIWLETGTGEGQVVYPRAIAYKAADDTFFVCDRLARIQHIDSRGRFLNEWRMPDWRTGKPVGLTVGPDGNLWVADTHYHRVVIYTPAGVEVRRFGSYGTGPGEFNLPTDIAFDAAGNVYVSEYGDNDRIQVFNAAGEVIRTIGKFGSRDGEFSRPQSMVIDGDMLYVTDACNHRIVVFNTDGTFVRNMGRAGTGAGEYRFPYGLDIDGKGRLVVCEFGNNRVQWIDPRTGAGLGMWGRGGREPGEMAYPWAVAVDKNDRVMAVDAGNNRVQVIGG